MVEVLFTAASGVAASPGTFDVRAPRLALSTDQVEDDVEIGDAVATVAVSNAGSGSWDLELVDDADGVFELDGNQLIAADEIYNDDETPRITIAAENGFRTVTQTFTLNKGGLPRLPTGYAFAVDAQGRYYVDQDGNFYIMEIVNG